MRFWKSQKILSGSRIIANPPLMSLLSQRPTKRYENDLTWLFKIVVVLGTVGKFKINFPDLRDQWLYNMAEKSLIGNWQIRRTIKKNRYTYLAVDQWLLVSEKYSRSTAHIDVAYSTWVSCLIGKKTFWVHNPLFEDQQVWKEFDLKDDHWFFEEPWARIDLYPGSIL